MVVARDILHVDLFQSVPLDLVAGHEVEQSLQRDGRFHPGQGRAQAAVNAVAEAEILCLGAIAVDVEQMRIGERPRIPVGGRLHQEDGLARRNGRAMQMRILQREAHVVLHGPDVPKEFLDSVRLDLFPDEVYVFTPRGDVKALPDGATPVDFAYTVHTDVGHHCVGAKVNGKLVPLRYTLHQGDIVEIVTSPTQHPSRDWLKIVKSNRARAKINQWLKIEERTRSLALGREFFEREARKYRLAPSTLLASDEMKKLTVELVPDTSHWIADERRELVLERSIAFFAGR